MVYEQNAKSRCLSDDTLLNVAAGQCAAEALPLVLQHIEGCASCEFLMATALQSDASQATSAPARMALTERIAQCKNSEQRRALMFELVEWAQAAGAAPAEPFLRGLQALVLGRVTGAKRVAAVRAITPARLLQVLDGNHADAAAFAAALRAGLVQ